jgi:hypothetical protein
MVIPPPPKIGSKQGCRKIPRIWHFVGDTVSKDGEGAAHVDGVGKSPQRSRAVATQLWLPPVLGGCARIGKPARCGRSGGAIGDRAPFPLSRTSSRITSPAAGQTRTAAKFAFLFVGP